MPTTNDNSIVTKGILRYFYNKLSNNINSLLSSKVDKEDGKGLSEENFTTEDKQKLDSLENYTLQRATSTELGGIKTGYQEQGKNYAVETDVDGNAYVSVPWTDTDTEYNVVSTTENGLAPMLPAENADTKYLRGDGTWQELNNGTDILNLVYPIGSIYLSLNSTNPSGLFGGTWEQFAQGRTLIGVGELNDGSTLKSFEVGATGGEFEHILSMDEMPQHGHPGLFVNQTRIGWKDSVFQTNTSGQAGIRTDSEYDVRTGDSGANSPHNIMQPYLAVYMFKRVS